MKQVEVKVCLYDIKELSNKAFERAMKEHKAFLVDIASYEYTEAEIDDYVDGLTEEYVIQDIEANEYMFFEDGELADVVHYVRPHPKAGKTVFKLGEKEYEI